MSRQANMRAGGVRRGPYGPNNPPPPPVAPPPEASESQSRGRPNLAIRRRGYARAEAENARGRDQERNRSRSPARPQDRRHEPPQYRERSPLRHERTSTQPRREDRTHETSDSVRCFACNEPGHRAADCSITQYFGRKDCFRCGEAGHIARACKVRVGQIKTDPEVVADKSNTNSSGYYKNDRGDDEGWSPLQNATTDGHVFGYTRDGYGKSQERSSMVPTRAGYYVEDEVDWDDDDDDDDDALETRNAAPAVGMNADRKTRQPEYPTYAMQNKYEKPHRHYEDLKKHTTATQNGSVKSTQRKSNWNPDRLEMAREPKLGLPHLRNAKIDDVPPTVHDLRGYDYRIQVMYGSKPMNQRFVNGGNGKIAPAIYGSEQRHDLGLCFATFLTRKRCEMGVNCPWRHHPLSNAERAWIVEYGKRKGKEFIENVDRWWSFPETPVPGANMHGLGDKDM